EEISDIANADILDHKMAEHLENSFKKSLNKIHALRQYHIAECYEHPSESLTEEFITEYTVEAITHEDFRDDKLTTVIRAEKHQICLELLKICMPVKDIDNRNRYIADIVKSCLESSDAKKSGLKSDKVKLVSTFDKESASKLLPYQTGEGQFYENSEDLRYGYSKLSSDELEIASSSDIQLHQELFDII
ncbi:644_t:CDS:2, partial [Scutellospora calospora]